MHPLADLELGPTEQLARVLAGEQAGQRQQVRLGRLPEGGEDPLGLGFLLTAGYLIVSLKKGRIAPANPWGGTTLEWACSSPPPYYNFHTPPVVTQGPYDGYENLVYDEKIGGYVPKKAKRA